MIYIKMNSKRLSIHPQIFVQIAIWIFAFCYYWQTRDLSKEALLFPRILCTGIFICGVFIMKDSVRIEAIVQEGGSAPSNDYGMPSHKILLFIAGIAISIWLFMNTVALVAVIPCAILLMYIAGVRSVKVMLSVAMGLSLFIYLFFDKWLAVNLPNVLY